MPKGGKRPGAGRPKGPTPNTLDKVMAREALRQIVIEHMHEMTAAQIAHAKGIKFLMARSAKGGKFERVTEAELDAILKGQDDGRVILEVWDKDPSVQAYTDLMNRALDKPAEHVELEHTGDLTFRWKDVEE